MISRKGAALAVALLALAPAMDLAATRGAAAQDAPAGGGAPQGGQQSAPTAQEVTAKVKEAVDAVKQSPEYAALPAAEKALRLAQAVQAAVTAALNAGAPASVVSTALATAVNTGVVGLSIAAQGAAQAAAQVAQQSAAPASAKSEAVALVTGLQTGSGDLGQQVAQTGGLQAAISAVNSQGQTVTAVTDLSTVLAAAATGNTGNATVNQNGTVTVGGQTGPATTPGSGYTPCTNVIADYC